MHYDVTAPRSDAADAPHCNVVRRLNEDCLIRVCARVRRFMNGGKIANYSKLFCRILSTDKIINATMGKRTMA